MVIVSGLIEVATASRERALAAAVTLAQATRREPGCLAYAFYADVENPNVVRVYEEWQDGDALTQHFTAPHVAEFRQALAGLEVVAQTIKRYDVSAATALG